MINSIGSSIGQAWHRFKDWADKEVDGFNDTDFGTKMKVGAAVGGAVAGGVAGYFAGQAQMGRQTVITRTYPVPDLYSKNLGQVPSDFTEYDWGSGWFRPSQPVDGSHGWDQVNRDAPKYDSNGGIVMKDQTTTLSSHQYGPVLGTLGGVTLGAGVGFLGALAVDVLLHFKDKPEY